MTYRGLLRDEHVTVKRPSVVSDGAGGQVVDIATGTTICARYFVRIDRPTAETIRVDRGSAEDTPWTYLGDAGSGILTGDVFIRDDGTEWTVVRHSEKKVDRVRAQARGILRRRRR